MVRQFLKAKIHNAVITQADLEYEGSLGIDIELMEQAGIAEFEAVEVYNITSGERLKTYAIAMDPGSRQITSNGAAAHRMKPNDRVIIASYHFIDASTPAPAPQILIMEKRNEVKKILQGRNEVKK